MKENSIKHLIDLIKGRPTMYITRNDIFCLKAYLDGWFFRNPDSVIDSDIMDKFQNWIERKYSINTHSWAHIIWFYSSDDNDALNNFFIKFDEFLLNENIN